LHVMAQRGCHHISNPLVDSADLILSHMETDYLGYYNGQTPSPKAGPRGNHGVKRVVTSGAFAAQTPGGSQRWLVVDLPVRRAEMPIRTSAIR